MNEADVHEPRMVEEPEAWARWWGNHVGELRWQAEAARTMVHPVMRGEGLPRGDGQPVMTIPGFLAGDNSLVVLRRFLMNLGYSPHKARIVVNVDCSDRAADRLEDRLVGLAERYGERVALVGHSRGGHFAKVLARRRPDLVAGVVSLGAGLDDPFRISRPTAGALAAVRSVHAVTTDLELRRGCLTTDCSCPFVRQYQADFPPEVPLTSIYTRGDGVVWWEACVVDYAHNVEVTGSHIGLAFNRDAFREIARSLASAYLERSLTAAA